MKNSPYSGMIEDAPSPRAWRTWVGWFLIVIFIGEISAAILLKRKDKTFAVSEFANLPLIFNGRVQPMDSLARNSLLQIRGITQVPLEGNSTKGEWGSWEALREKEGQLFERKWYQFSKRPDKLMPAAWLLEVLCDAQKADDRYIFVINHPDLRGLMKLDGGVEKSALHFYRFNDIKNRLDALKDVSERASQLDASQRTSFDRAVLQLNNAFALYFRLKNTLQPEDSADFNKELNDYLAAVQQARTAVQQRDARGEQLDREAIDELLAPVQKLAHRYEVMSRMTSMPLIVPLAEAGKDHERWYNMGTALLEGAREEMPQPVRLLARIASAYRAGDVRRFNEALFEYRTWLLTHGFTTEVTKGDRETFFNKLLAFKRSIYIYLTAFLLVLLYWANLNETWRQTGARLLIIGLAVHTVGLGFRMWLEGRPPVTNLYSSAIFIGWGAVVLGLVLEHLYKNGIGLAVAAKLGFLSLIVAHNLSLDGDTMVMLQAVLDTNFWLATHVVMMVLGYASTFVAGFLAIIYVLMGIFTRNLTNPIAKTSPGSIGGTPAMMVKRDIRRVSTRLETSAAERGDMGKSLARMVYGIVCFATLFSFVGTVLGGIWADQSWGRFWGWDPKENGALIIVLWNALVLHLRWGGMVRERGLMNCAIVGNIVTSWSWFGVNMLGTGLHSYGFMSGAFKWLALFVGSQLLLIGLGVLPLKYWRSFRQPASQTARS